MRHWKRLAAATGVALLAFMTMLVPTLGHGFVDQVNGLPESGWEEAHDGLQTFTPAQGNLAAIDLYLRINPAWATPEDIDVEVRVEKASDDLDLVVATETVPGGTTGGWFHFDFIPAHTLEPGQLYELHVDVEFIDDATTGSFDRVQWAVVAGNPYANGAAFQDEGFIGPQAYDFVFQTYFEDTTPPDITYTLTPPTPGDGGWYNTDVTLDWTVTELESPGTLLTVGCSDITHTTDQPFTTYTCTASSAGGGPSSVQVSFGRDTTPPVITEVSRTTSSGTWTSSDITITFTCTDPGPVASGVATDTVPDITVSTQGENQSVTTTGDCVDNAGNVAAPLTVDGINIDKTAPTAELVVTAGTLGTNGWYTTDVTIETQGTDDLSPFTCTADQFQTTETTGQVFNGSCTNDAGLTTNAIPITIKLDETGPSADLAVTAGTPGTNGWYTSDVTVTATGSDSISGPVTCTPTPQFQTTETTGAPFDATCTNQAGLSTDAATLNVKLDKTGPTGVLLTPVGTLGLDGWYISDVVVTTTGTDDISSPVTCTADQPWSADTAGQMFNGSCTNDAGLTTDATPITIKVDQTLPVITPTVSGTPGLNGWYISDVTVAFACTDAMSGVGVDSLVTPVLLTEGENQSVVSAGSCIDEAGNVADPASVLDIDIDTSAPIVSVAIVGGTPGTNGWYTSTVEVEATGTDTISEPVTCEPNVFWSTETAGQLITLSCTNEAGLIGSASLTVKLDLSGPVSVLLTPVGTLGLNGWFISDVTVNTSGIDPISGPVECTAPQFFSADTAGELVSGDCTNQAGLTTPASDITIKIDQTAPTATVTALGTLGANDWFISDVTIHTEGTDNVSEPLTCTPDVLWSAETAGQLVGGSCTNEAGLTTAATPILIKVDQTGPTNVLLDPIGTLGLNGWYISDVTVNTSGDDNISGIASCTAPQLFTADTPPPGVVVSGSCTNNAGLPTPAPDITIKIDQTAPEVTLEIIDGDLGANGWYTSAVRVEATGTDNVSVPVTCDDDVIWGANTAGQMITMSCMNDAGLIGSASVIIKVDTTPPTNVILTPAGTLGLNGWYISNVTVTTTGNEDMSGITCTAPQVFTDDTPEPGVDVDGSCTSGAGLTTFADQITIKIDQTIPTAEVIVSVGTLGANDWYITDVTISTVGTDDISGIMGCTADIDWTAETAGQLFNGTCINNAGLESLLATFVLKLDKTGPTAELVVTAGTLGNNGWYVSDVTVSTVGDDPMSPPVVCTDDQFQTTETDGEVFEGSCTNEAGITTDATPLVIKLDKTPPTLTISVPSPVEQGSTMFATPNASDALSGVASATCDPMDTSTVGTHSVSCTAIDNAGNSTTASASFVVEESIIVGECGEIAFGFPPPIGGGIGTFAFSCGTFAQLLAASGCPASTSAFFYNKPNGTYAVWIPGSQVAAVNQEIFALFPNDSIPANTIFSAKCV